MDSFRESAELSGGSLEASEKMATRRDESKRNGNVGTNTFEKGRLVEALTAAFHESPDVTIERNVRIPVANSRRTREVDVLLSGKVAGYPVRLAFECKNYGKPIGAPEIDAFVGKLADIGLPSQCGIYVSAGGFTSGAMERASKVGLRTLILTGLSSDRLTAQVEAAIQSVIYLHPNVATYTISVSTEQLSAAHTQLDTSKGSAQIFVDHEGEVVGTVFDWFVNAWRMGAIPARVGVHEIGSTGPENLYVFEDGHLHALHEIKATVEVRAYVINFHGTGHRHFLLDASSHEWERVRANADFEFPAGNYPVSAFETEESLEDFLSQRREPLQVSNRVRLPRVRCGYIYWPPRRTVLDELRRRVRLADSEAAAEGRALVPNPRILEGLESENLTDIWRD